MHAGVCMNEHSNFLQGEEGAGGIREYGGAGARAISHY